MFKHLVCISMIALLFVMAGVGRIQAQDAAKASVTLPVLSYFFDGSTGLRPLIGISGSAAVGNALDLGFPISGAVVPAGHDYILTTSTDKSWPQLLQLRGGAITVQPMASSQPESDV